MAPAPPSPPSGGRGADRGRVAVLALAGAAVLVVLAVILVVVDDDEHLQVAVVGDSVTALAAGALPQAFSWSSGIDVQGRPGWRTDELVPVAQELVAREPEVLVLLTGYNDILQQVDPEAGLQRMREVAARAPCTVWMLIPVKGGYERERAEAYNRRLAEITGPVPSIHLSSRWRDVVDAPEGPAPDPDLVSGDMVHPTEAGAGALAVAMEQAVGQLCPPS